MRVLVASAWLSVLAVGGCANEQAVIQQQDAPAHGQDCALVMERLQTTEAEINANLNGLLGRFEGGAAYQGLEDIRSGFDHYQRDFNAGNSALCEDFERGRISPQEYAQRRRCLEQRLTMMRVMEGILNNPNLKDSQALTWELDAKLDFVLETMRCEERAPQPPSQIIVNTEAGGLIDERGSINQGALHLEVGAAPLRRAEITLQAQLHCQRPQAQRDPAPLGDCERETLQEGDQLRVELALQGDAYIYLYLYNSSGQFQMLYPEDQQDNLHHSGRFFFPGQSAWADMDGVSGVQEHLHVLATSHPLRELEALRGRDTPSQEVQRFRGVIEPFIFRSLKPSQPQADPNPVQITASNVAAVEFQLSR